MQKHYVISLSIGTALLACAMTFSVVGAILYATVTAHSKIPSPDAFRPRVGASEVIESHLNDLKYGEVNVNATKEVKNGLPLFDRIRANRQSRVCAPVVQQYCPPCPTVVVTNNTPYSLQAQPTYRVVDPTDCTYSYVVSNPVPNQVIITQPTGIEMPAILPAKVQDEASPCPDGKCKPKQAEAVKTGSFICTNCRKSQVGEWHTEWKSDGTPTTFLCKSCFAIMSPEQRERAYIGYLSRQSKTVGTAGLLHQELSQ